MKPTGKLEDEHLSTEDTLNPWSEHIERGTRLLGAAAMVGDQDDFHTWRAKRNLWVERVTDSLLVHRPTDVETFRQVASTPQPRSTWHVALTDELERAKLALALLQKLTRSDTPA